MDDARLDLSISVLMPVYFPDFCVEDIWLLRRALESVHDQQFPGEYEILIVDDGCPIPFAEVIGAVGASYLRHARCVRSWRNYGIVHALNVGLAEAKYSWIARLDADDRWLPGKIEQQVATLLQDPDLTLCATGMRLVDLAGKPYELHLRSGNWLDILHFFAHVGCPFPHGSILARKDIYRLLGGYSHQPAVSHCEDYALWGTWLRFFKPTIVEEVLFEYTVSQRSVSGVHRLQQVRGSEEVSRCFRDLNITSTLPAALQGLARSLDCSLIDAGNLAYAIWRVGPGDHLPEPSHRYLNLLLPDREFIRA